ncbi:MAG: DUF2752 domain-containing protein [Acutalibacteraceae bacterium]
MANMKLRRALRRGGKAALGLLAVAAGLFLLYQCPFRYVFGVSCPGCGMTRALLAAVFSDFETAFSYHPLFPLLIQRRSGWPARLRRLPSKRETAYILAFAGAFILVYAARLLSGDPVVAPEPASGLLFRVLPGLLR